MMKKPHGLSLLVLMVVVAFSVQAEVETEARGIFYEIFSPYCPGRSLADCPTEPAEKLRQQITQELRNGKSSAEVTEEVIAKIGEQYRAAPKAEGVGLLAWGLPIIFALIGGVLIFFLRKPSTPIDSSVDDDSAYTPRE